MDAEENSDTAGASVTVDDILEESLELASESFDPLRMIYAPSLEINENVEAFESVSQFIEHVDAEIREELSHEKRRLPSSTLATKSEEENKPTKIMKMSPKHDELAENIDIMIKAPVTDYFNKHVSENIAEKSMKGEIPAESQTETKRLQSLAESVQALVQKSESETLDTSKESANKTTSSQQSSKRNKAKITVLTQMENGFQQGPLSILRRSVQEKIKVRVWTRSVRNIRGISTGYIVAFDKHMNLAMMDVDEVYRKPLGKHQRKRKKPKDAAVSSAETSENSKEAEAQYPKIPWQPVERQLNTTGAAGGGSRNTLYGWVCDDSSDEEHWDLTAGGSGNLTSKFEGMHVFEETEATRLLGIKSRRVLTRHLNQVLLRGENVVAVSLVELNV